MYFLGAIDCNSMQFLSSSIFNALKYETRILYILNDCLLQKKNFEEKKSYFDCNLLLKISNCNQISFD